MEFIETLRPTHERIVDKIVAHPMVDGLGDGSLDPAPFRYWVKQDYCYLTEYNRVFALGASKAPDLDRMGTFATLLDATLTEEMDLHRAYAAEFDISEAELEATAPSPTTRAYTDFLVRTAALGTFDDLLAALLPCMWGFHDTAVRLRESGMPDEPRYAEWVRTYTDEEFAELVTWCKELLDERAVGLPDARQRRVRELFETSARYEYLFWDAAWREEAWPV
ncbi:thiaminase II [Natronomonas sp. EA1]|uniref:thiaminase II n=1 Tax=Natronomonas sp. EA1 TaxID=3421655 RepID=UPI003EB8A2FB